MCDFEDGSCNWQQQTDDDLDWVRQSGPSLAPNTGPDSDHTTNTPTGHYFYLSSSLVDRAGQMARMSSALYPAGETGPHFSPLKNVQAKLSVILQHLSALPVCCVGPALVLFSHVSHARYLNQ